MSEFAPELDRYEREVATRASETTARDARREIAAHLEADLAARLELGIPEPEARAQAFAALGDLRQAARAERQDPRLTALRLAAPLALLGWIAAKEGHRLWPDFLSGVPLLVQIIALFSTSLVAGFYAGFGRNAPPFRGFLVVWALVFAAISVQFGLDVLTDDSARVALRELLIVGIGLLLPGAMGFGLGLTTYWVVSVGGVGLSGRAFCLMRLLAPSVHVTLELLTLEFDALAGMRVPALVVLVGFGMYDRRRPDARAIAVGYLIAASSFLIWYLVPHRDFAIQYRGPIPTLIYTAGVWLVVLLILQLFGLAFWSSIRWIAARRRPA